MPLVRAFYCSPVRAEELGYELEESYTLSRSEAKKLRDEYEKMEQGQAWAVSVVLGVLGVAIKATVYAIGFAIGSATATAIASDFFQQLDNDFDEIATGDSAFADVILTYKYKRHGSNDGAYFLSSVDVA